MVERLKAFVTGKLFPSADGKPDNWKFRRKLIFGSYKIALFIILIMLPIAIFMPELEDLAIASIQAMVGMLSIIVSAYVGGAVIDDKLNRKDEDIEP